MILFNDSVTHLPSYLSELSFLSEPGVCICPVLNFNPLLEKTDLTHESKARLIDIGCQRKCSGSETSGCFSSFEPAGTSRPKEDASGRKTKAGTIFHHDVNMHSSAVGLNDMLAFIIAGECMETHRRPGFSAEDSGEILM